MAWSHRYCEAVNISAAQPERRFSRMRPRSMKRHRLAAKGRSKPAESRYVTHAHNGMQHGFCSGCGFPAKPQSTLKRKEALQKPYKSNYARSPVAARPRSLGRLAALTATTNLRLQVLFSPRKGFEGYGLTITLLVGSSVVGTPENITIVTLLPYAPELNPVESIQAYLRENSPAVPKAAPIRSPIAMQQVVTRRNIGRRWWLYEPPTPFCRRNARPGRLARS